MTGVIAHNDAGTQYTSLAFGAELAEHGLLPSIGSVGDAFDNALAETIIGLYKTECIRSDSPFRDGPLNTTTDVDTPQSVALDFQTGVAPKTLIFGSVRWVDWSEFSIEPPVYAELTQAITGAPRPLVEYADDWWTYSLGMGHQFTDTLAGSLSVTYEPDVGGVMTTLGPYDGRTLATAALSYDLGRANVTGGVTYGRLGDTTNLLATDFDDGSVWGAGVRVGYSF